MGSTFPECLLFLDPTCLTVSTRFGKSEAVLEQMVPDDLEKTAPRRFGSQLWPAGRKLIEMINDFNR
jgi:hypothetical protein